MALPMSTPHSRRPKGPIPPKPYQRLATISNLERYPNDDAENEDLWKLKCDAIARRYLAGQAPYLISASLRGPFDRSSGWVSPWSSQSEQTPKASPTPVLSMVPKPVSATNEKYAASIDCHLPSPESLTQSAEDVEHPYLDENEIVRVNDWMGSIPAAAPVKDDFWTSNATDSTDTRKRKATSSSWLRTIELKRLRSDHYLETPTSGIAATLKRNRQSSPQSTTVQGIRVGSEGWDRAAHQKYGVPSSQVRREPEAKSGTAHDDSEDELSIVATGFGPSQTWNSSSRRLSINCNPATSEYSQSTPATTTQSRQVVVDPTSITPIVHTTPTPTQTDALPLSSIRTPPSSNMQHFVDAPSNSEEGNNTESSRRFETQFDESFYFRRKVNKRTRNSQLLRTPKRIPNASDLFSPDSVATVDSTLPGEAEDLWEDYSSEVACFVEDHVRGTPELEETPSALAGSAQMEASAIAILQRISPSKARQETKDSFSLPPHTYAIPEDHVDLEATSPRDAAAVTPITNQAKSSDEPPPSNAMQIDADPLGSNDSMDAETSPSEQVDDLNNDMLAPTSSLSVVSSDTPAKSARKSRKRNRPRRRRARSRMPDELGAEEPAVPSVGQVRLVKISSISSLMETEPSYLDPASLEDDLGPPVVIQLPPPTPTHDASQSSTEHAPDSPSSGRSFQDQSSWAKSSAIDRLHTAQDNEPLTNEATASQMSEAIPSELQSPWASTQKVQAMLAQNKDVSPSTNTSQENKATLTASVPVVATPLSQIKVPNLVATPEVPTTPPHLSTIPTPEAFEKPLDASFSMRSFSSFVSPCRPSTERRTTLSSHRLARMPIGILSSAQRDPLSSRSKSNRRVSWNLPNQENSNADSPGISPTIRVTKSLQREGSPPPSIPQPSEVEGEAKGFNNHFAAVARRKPPGFQRLLPLSPEQVPRSPPTDAMATVFVEADQIQPLKDVPPPSVTTAEAQTGQENPSDSPEEHFESSAGPTPAESAPPSTDDVDAVLGNLDEFLDLWDVDADLERSRNEGDKEKEGPAMGLMDNLVVANPWV